MALEYIRENLDGLGDEIKSLYKEQNGQFTLDLNGIDDQSALKRAKDHERDARKSAEDRSNSLADQIKALQNQLDVKKTDELKIAGNIEALEKSWNEKNQKQETEYKTKIDGLNGNLNKLLVDREALSMAAELAIEGSASLLLPHIKARLTINADSTGELGTSVLDPQGKPSALTVEELKQEFLNNPAFSAVLVGSKASGGSASTSAKPGSAGVSKGDLSKMDRQEKLAYFAIKKTA